MRNESRRYQQNPSNRTLLLPFVNGSHAQRVRLLDFWEQKDAIYIWGPKPKNSKIQVYGMLNTAIIFRSFFQGMCHSNVVSVSDTLANMNTVRRRQFEKRYEKIQFIIRSQNRGRPTAKGYELYFAAKIPQGYDYSTPYDYSVSAGYCSATKFLRRFTSLGVTL